MFAVIELAGKQHRVSSGDTVLVDGTYDGALAPRVLMIADGSKVVTGAGALGGATVEATAVEPVRQRLPRAMRFKPKQGGSCKRSLGHRRVQTRVKIGSIKLAGK